MRWRLAAFGLAIGLVVLTLAWAAQSSWRQVEDLSEKLNRVQIESFQTANEFRAGLQDLNNLLFRFKIQRDTNVWNQFLSTWKTHDKWIDVIQPTLTTTGEVSVLNLINAEYDDYFAAARDLSAAVFEGAESSRLLPASERVDAESTRLLELDKRLLEAHRASLTQFLSTSHQSLSFLRGLILVALIALLALGASLAVVAYHELVTPLQMKLVETHAIIERQEKLASLGVLAAGVAHEIRNPLTAIKARLFTQQKNLRQGSAEAGDAAFIGKEINRLERIVKDFLLFARPAEPKLEAVSADALLRNAHELLLPQLERGGIQLRLGSMVNVKVQADAQQIQQVLINLIQNAAEAIDRQGVVTLAARAATQRLGGQSTNVVILEVSDTGKGIQADVQKRLFDPFFTTKEAGTGLGLSIAARIMEKHGGGIEFQTEPNRGTTFGIVLPQVDAR